MTIARELLVLNCGLSSCTSLRINSSFQDDCHWPRSFPINRRYKKPFASHGNRVTFASIGRGQPLVTGAKSQTVLLGTER